jgi:hypothetical protein
LTRQSIFFAKSLTKMMDTRVKPAYDDHGDGDTARRISKLSSPAKAGDPVRRGFSVQSPTPLEYWITRFRG